MATPRSEIDVDIIIELVGILILLFRQCSSCD